MLTWITVAFVFLAAADRIFGSKLGLGKEFERGIKLLGDMALSMIGMIVLSPMIAWLLEPVFGLFKGGLDASIIPAVLFANDMGGAALSLEIAQNPAVGGYHAFVVSSMMGATISFTIPFALSAVAKEKQKALFFGVLCGVVTIPVGSFFGGLIARVPFGLLILNLLPLVLVASVLAFFLVKCPKGSIKAFSYLGIGMKALITVGLAMGIFSFLTGIEIPHTASLQEGADICVNAACVMAGMFPLIYLASKMLDKPLQKVSKKIGINETSVLGFVGTLATNVTTLGLLKDMDEKGAVLNSAFLVSASWTFAGHLAFTQAFDSSYLLSMIVAKLVAGVCAVLLAGVLFKVSYQKANEEKREESGADGVTENG